MSSAPTPKKKLAAQVFSVMLGNTLDEVTTLNQWIEAIANQVQLSSELYFKLNLILEESVTNIIQHGFRSDRQGQIDISVGFDDHQVHVEVKDNGVPFNPLEDHQIILPETLETTNIGGLGIHLMKSYAHSIGYRRVDDINILNLTMNSSDPIEGEAQ